MRFILIRLLSLLLSTCFILTLVQRSQGKGNNQIEAGDYIDVPVRAGYRIMGNDDDGYLEDGIIVKTKGTGYIDSRYRKKYYQQQKLLNPIADSSTIARQMFAQESRERRHDQFYPKKYETAASSYVPRYYSSVFPKKYLKSEIIYGRREW